MGNQPTKKCPHCKTEIDATAKKCPQCHSDLRSWFAKHPILTIFGALFLIGLIIGIASPPSNTGNSNTSQNTKQTTTNTSSSSQTNINISPSANTNTASTREQAIKIAVEKAIGAKTNMGEARVRLIKVSPYADSSRIELNGDENLTNKMTRDGLSRDALKAYQAIFATDANPNLSVELYMYLKGADVYGNVSYNIAIQSKLTRVTADKIQWDNVLFENIPRVFDYYYEAMRFD